MMITNGGFFSAPYGPPPFVNGPNNFGPGQQPLPSQSGIPLYYGSNHQPQSHHHHHPINQQQQQQLRQGNVNYKLYYFDTRGRGEVIRLVLAFAGVPFKDKRVKPDEWAVLKEQMPLGQLPVLRINNHWKLPQTQAIVRYLATEYHLYGTGKHDHAVVDIILETDRDLKEKIFSQGHTDDIEQRRAAIRQFLTDDGTIHLKRLEKLFEVFNRHGPFYLGSHVSVADLAVYDTIWHLIDAEPKLLDAYPRLKSARRRLEKHPQMFAYLHTQANKTKVARSHKSPHSTRHLTKSPTPIEHHTVSKHHRHPRHRSYDGQDSKHQHRHHHRRHHRSKEPISVAQTQPSNNRHRHGSRRSKSPSIASTKNNKNKETVPASRSPVPQPPPAPATTEVPLPPPTTEVPLPPPTTEVPLPPSPPLAAAGQHSQPVN